MRNILWQNPDLAYSSLNATEPVSFTFDDAQWFIYRCADYAFACKAGSNAEQHNHNDVGSFMISKAGAVTFTDPGVGEYTRQYFGSERYELMLCSSRGHSVPIINGKYQICTSERAKLLRKEERAYEFTMEHVYDVPELKSLIRGFECEDGFVRMTDKYGFSKAPESLTERFISLSPIEECAEGIKSEASVIAFDKSAYTVSFGSELVSRHGGAKTPVYYADVEPKKLSPNMTLVFEIK